MMKTPEEYAENCLALAESVVASNNIKQQVEGVILTAVADALDTAARECWKVGQQGGDCNQAMARIRSFIPPAYRKGCDCT